MADEAFALSPISARATQPREEDYAAISEAFMETSRGRWFLTEYAKRNRNADTTMVLDAVARIEASLAAQRDETARREEILAAQDLVAQKLDLVAQQQQVAAQQQAVAEAAEAAIAAAESRLKDALSAIRGAVDAAQVSAVAALDDAALEPKLAPLRKAARVIREISWRLREIGNDGRICDLIDSQVSAIESGAAQLSSDEAKTALGAAFAALAGRLAEFDTAEAVASPVAEAPVAASPAAAAEVAEIVPAPEAFAEPEIVAKPQPETVWTEPAPAAELDTTPIDAVADDEADAHDEAVLDIIAMEMGAPQPDEFDEPAVAMIEELPAEELVVEEPPMMAPPPAIPAVVQMPIPLVAPEPAPASIPMLVESAPMAPVEAAPVEMSLGSSLLASGIVKKPVTAGSDPLAPIRRMSQAEKIAFFS